jgi:C_GCAxxG_C_C family probable redox protein
MKKTEIAARYHDLGYGCAQSVLCAFIEDFGLDEETALRISTGFGSGMGRLCELCGALAGGCMVIGLKYGKVVTDGSKYGTETETTYRLAAEMARRFASRNGAIRCWDLLHLDLSRPEERQRALDEGIFENQCGNYIQDVVEILVEILPDVERQEQAIPQSGALR